MPPKKMDIREFKEQGYLQELNRLFLHPLGLALGVGPTGHTGELQLSLVLDARDDPDGYVFDTPLSQEKATFVALERSKRLTHRQQLPQCDDRTGIQRVTE